jgi:hypothetical protein
VYITDVDNNPTSHMPLLLGLVNYFERHMPYGEGGICLQQCPAASTAGAILGVCTWLRNLAASVSTKCSSRSLFCYEACVLLIRIFRTRYNARCMCVLFLGN